jgi:hypothetical protein
MVARIGSSTKGPRIEETSAPKPAQTPPEFLANPAGKSKSRGAGLARPDAFKKAGKSATSEVRRETGAGRKADKSSFKKGAEKSRAGKGTGESKTRASTELAKAAHQRHYSVQGAVHRISDLFSHKAGPAQAREATGIIESFKNGKDLGSVVGGIRGQTLQSLLLESKWDSRSSLVGHVASHGDARARETLSGGIHNEIERIRQGGTDWIKHPAPPGLLEGPGGSGGHASHGGAGYESNVRQFECSVLAKSAGGGGDGGRGPLG